MSSPDAENNFALADGNNSDNMTRCSATNKYDTTINNGKNIEIQVPDSRCEKSKQKAVFLSAVKKIDRELFVYIHSCEFIGNQFCSFFYVKHENENFVDS